MMNIADLFPILLTVIISVDMATAEKQYLMKAKNITSGDQ